MWPITPKTKGTKSEIAAKPSPSVTGNTGEIRLFRAGSKANAVQWCVSHGKVRPELASQRGLEEERSDLTTTSVLVVAANDHLQSELTDRTTVGLCHDYIV